MIKIMSETININHIRLKVLVIKLSRMKQFYNYITKDHYTYLTSLIRKAIIVNIFIVRWLKKYTIYINKNYNE